MPPTLSLTPHGRLLWAHTPSAPPVDPTLAARLEAASARGDGALLLTLGLDEVATALPPVFAWWRDLATRYLTAVCTLPEGDDDAALPSLPPPTPEAWATEVLRAPPMEGAEYLDATVLTSAWQALDVALREALADAREPLQAFLQRHHPRWNLVGRVCLHLAENRKDPTAPFAFLATYTTRLSAQGKAQHVPLRRALDEYAGADDRERLLALLLPLQRASARCPWLADLLASQEVFHPLRWSVSEALAMLRDLPHLEAAGVVVRMPASWRGGRPQRPKVSATVGIDTPSRVGKDALLDFSVDVVLDGEPLSEEEVQQLLADSKGLQLIRGQWVEVDRENLVRTLERFEQVERAAEEGLGLHDALRLVAGATPDEAEHGDWAEVHAGPWLSDTLASLRGPEGLAAVDPGPELVATLRPYQRVGLRWLHLLSSLQLGACLADDMGLGKTIQVIALLLVRRQREGQAASLLVAPASLLANWADEVARFAPSLRVLVAHTSAMPAQALADLTPEAVAPYDLVITTYGSLHRHAWLAKTPWRLLILDEAQAIKNPGTRQTKAAKKVPAGARIALTGTPIENRLGDLWSIFDFLNPGLLGTGRAFTRFTRSLAESPTGYAPLRTLVEPYILRRLKTDRRVLSDLPDKTELTAYCGLSRPQAALYRQAVQELEEALQAADGVQRKGLILSYLLRFKQICNHPSQWLRDERWEEADSGKLGRLRELAEVIAAKQEKVLVFSQFRETTGPLASFLGGIFGRPGLVLTGETPVRKRKDLVKRFQEDDTVPFFVLSLKAAGSGLNLTAASHVVHFDRWWNPAVENQATDRAFRIGQTRNVLVHKFLCRGTIEEKIAEMIADKRALADDLLSGSGEVKLTELDDAALLSLVRLDLSSAQSEV